MTRGYRVGRGRGAGAAAAGAVRRGLPALALALGLAASSAAQAPPAPPPADGFAEAIDVSVVEIDVVVTDARGNPLVGLTRDRFTLYEDGRRVEIAYFSGPAAAAGEDSPVAAAVDPATATAPGEAPARQMVTWAILVDSTHLRPGPRNEALRRLGSLLAEGMAEEDRGVVASFDGQAFRVRGALEPPPGVRQRVGELQGEKWSPGPMAMQEVATRSEIQQADQLTDAWQFAMAIDAIIEAEAARTSNAIAAVGSLLDVVAGAEGRVVVVYVGAGFQLLPGMTVTEYWRQRFPNLAKSMDGPRPEDYRQRLRGELARLFDRIAASRATFYTIDAGEPSWAMLGADDPGFLETDAAGLAGTERLEETGTARELAARTGGLYFRANPELARQLTAVRGDLEHAYSLGYVPADPTPGRERRIRVEVDVPGARVRTREAFRARTAEEQAQDLVVTALFDASPRNPLGIAVELGEPRRAGGGRGRVLPATVHIPVDSLAFVVEGGVHRAEVELHFALATADGTLWRLDSRQLPVSIPAAELATALGQRISYTVEVPYQAAGTRVSVSVHDVHAGVRSVAAAP